MLGPSLSQADLLILIIFLIMAAEEEIWDRLQDIKQPSTVKPIVLQSEGTRPLIVNCRPSSNTTLPPELAHPILASLSSAIRSLALPSATDMEAAFELCGIASEYYDLEVRPVR
jgi:hypothetical protein